MTDRSTESRPARPGPASSSKPARPATDPAASPTAAPTTGSTKPPLAERIQARLNRAAQEHQASKDAKPATAATASAGRSPRRARLRLTRIDPWSVMKTAFLLSVAFGIVTVVSVFIVWSVLDGAGVWDSINTTVGDVVGEEGAADFDVENYVGTSRVLGFTMLIAAVDVVLLTAIATLGAFLYNMAAALLGGVELTLAEDN